MDTLEALGRRIATTEDLRSIVRTMKSLSAVSIRQYDQAVSALRAYAQAIEAGFQAVLRRERPPLPEVREPGGATIAIVFGSDHGLCGRFNREIAGFTGQELARRRIARAGTVFLVAGARAAAELEAAGETVARTYPLPGTVNGLTATAEAMLLEVDARHPARVLVLHNMRAERSAAEPRAVQLLPLDRGWLRRLGARRWPSRALPAYTMQSPALFAALVRQHLFIGVFRAGAESAASEHAMRLGAMQAAERSIEERLSEMSAAYRRIRQAAITDELMDVVAGYEALAGADPGGV